MQKHHKILFLPRWYPTAYDLQNGVFIQKHAKAAAVHNEVVVLFAAPAPKKVPPSKSTNRNLTELMVYYKITSFRLLNIIRFVVALFSGWRMLRNAGFNPDLCHVNMLTRPAILALWLKWRFGIPYIITEHWTGYLTGWFERYSPLKKWLIRNYIVKKAAFLTSVSELLKTAMIRCGMSADIKILPNVVELLPDAWKQGPDNSKFRYLVVADLRDEIKNISGVIHAFTKVNKQEPMTELVIVGDGNDRKALEQLATDYSLTPSPMERGVRSVSFLGEKSNEDVLKIIPTTHVLIVNSRFETFSVVTLEAIFSGRPVIATRCGGPEQFVNHENGILIEKDNGKQLEEAMIKMKNNYSQYAPEKVKNSVPYNYDLESIAEVLDKYYDEVTIINHKS